MGTHSLPVRSLPVDMTANDLLPLRLDGLLPDSSSVCVVLRAL